MKKQTFSLSSIVSTIIILSFILIVIPISYVSYSSFEKNLEENILSYLDQVKNSTETFLEHESLILEHKAQEYSVLLSRVGDVEQLNMDEDISLVDIDLFFIKKKEEIINLSASLYDTDAIIDGLVNVYENDSCINNVRIQGKIHSIIVRSEDIINPITGKLEGSVYVGKILNENIEFLERINEKVDLKGISFYYDRQIIATSLKDGTPARRILTNIDNYIGKNQVYSNTDVIFAKLPLECGNKFTGVYLIPSVKSANFNELRESNSKQLLFLILIFMTMGLLSFLAVHRFVVQPMKKLLNYARDLKDDQKANFNDSIISEYNVLASGLEDVIAQLRDVKEQYSMAVDGIQEGLWDWHIKDNYFYFSPKCKEMLGYQPDEIQMDIEKWRSFIFEEDKSCIDKSLIAHLKQEVELFEEDFRVVCKDGSIKWLKTKAKALFDENGRAYRMLGFFSDIDHIKKLEEENRQKEVYIIEQSKMSAMGDMLSNIAHQWRQPLSLITTVVSGIKVTMELDLFDKKDILKDLDLVTNTSQELSKTIETFKDTYEFGNKKEDVNLGDLIEQDLELLAPAYEYQNIRFVSTVESIEYYGFKDEFLLILNKILHNAKEALNAKELKQKFIFLTLTQDDDNIILKIKDNAGGVDESIKERIFDPYFTTKHKAQGVGLSLYMSKNLATKYFKGDLRFKNVEFEYQNNSYSGAKFTLTFPKK